MKGLCEGDVVRPKSGGPKMTVEALVDLGGGALCVWFTEDGVVHRDRFISSMLIVCGAKETSDSKNE